MIEVLKQALEALETELSIDWTNNDEFNASAEKMYEAIAAIKEAIAELESQEPAAWTLLLVGEHHGVIGKVGEKFLGHPEHYERVDVYTHPPQRTWVGLTDEDWKEIEDMPDTFDQGVAWAQAKLKEKNR